MDKIVFFDVEMESLLRIVVVGTLTYISMIILLRVSGKRTLASMNAFDFIITVTMGSAFGRILTAKSISFFEALTTFTLLVFLQFIVSYLSLRSEKFRTLITTQPTLLYYNGAFLKKNLKKERLKETEIKSAMRSGKISSMDEVEAVVFESDGSLSVIKKSGARDNLTYKKFLE